MIPIHRQIGQGMRIHFEKLVNWHGKNELLPVYLENIFFNFYLNREVKSTETNNVNDVDQLSCEGLSAVGKRGWHISALVSPTITLNRDVAPIGDDIEPVGECRADVEMGNEDDEEPLEAEIPRVRIIRRIQRVERNKNMKIQDMLSTGVGVLLVLKVEVLVVNIELNCWKQRRERTNDSDRSFRLRFSDTGKRRHVSNSDLSRQQVWSNGSDML